MIGVTIKDAVDTRVTVTLKWNGTRIKMEGEGGAVLPGDLDLDPGDVLDALTVLAAQRVDRDKQHRTHAYTEYVGPGTALGAFRDQLTGKEDESE